MNVLCIVDRDHERSVVVLDQKLKTKKLLKIPSVHPLPPSLPALSAGGKGEGGRVEPPTKFSKRGGGLTGPQLLEGVCWERGGVTFFRKLQFSHKK